MEVPRVTKGRPSVLRADYYECRACARLDRDPDWCEYGHKCGHCGAPANGGLLYFPMSVHLLIDLIQEAFHLSPSASVSEGESGPSEPLTANRLAVVVFFCTLNEVLLRNLFISIAQRQNLSRLIVERLLEDNRGVRRQIERLFPSMVGDTWESAIKGLPNAAAANYVAVSKFLIEASKERNRMLHSGVESAIPLEMPAACLKAIGPTLELYVALHNQYATR
jgi:hypothetical protein